MRRANHDQDRYAAMAARAEAEEYTSVDQLDEMIAGTSTTAEELDELLQELNDLDAEGVATPAGAPSTERATAADLRELTALGRPSLSGLTGAGPSPKRQVRLSKDQDAALTARAAIEHRSASDILRDALDLYLARAS